MKIISQREKITDIEYKLEFLSPDGNRGYGFDCDKEGNPILSSLNHENYQRCLAGEIKGLSTTPVVNAYTNQYINPAIGKCDRCGGKVSLEDDYNVCEGCGTPYNLSGQELLRMEQWEPEDQQDYLYGSGE